MKIRMLTTAIATSLLLAGPVSAQTMENASQEVKDAWLDGQIETVLVLNQNLNPFDINTDVEQGKVILTGKVDSSAEKALAGELVKGIDDVTDVDNRLTVVNEDRDADRDEPGMMDTLSDTSVTTVVKTRLLMSSDVDGTDIDVDTEQGVTTLSGEVDSSAEHDLAIQLAKNVNGVKDVVDELHMTH